MHRLLFLITRNGVHYKKIKHVPVIICPPTYRPNIFFRALRFSNDVVRVRSEPATVAKRKNNELFRFFRRR